jgi:hypothetical protein
MRAGSAPLALAVVTVLLSASPIHAHAAGVRTEVDRLPPPTIELQTILDVQPDRLLFLEYTGPDSFPVRSELKIKDRSTGQITTIPEIPNQLPGRGLLTSRGAIFSTDKETYPYSELWEWRDGTLVDLGGLNSWFDANLKYTAWTGDDLASGSYGLFQRNIETGKTVTVGDHAGNTSNDLAPNGAIAYWIYPGYTIGFYRNGLTRQLTAGDPSLWATYPLTDGENVVYRKASPCCSNDSGSVALFTSGGEIGLDSFRNQWPSPGTDYAIAGGWVAYTRDDGAGGYQVWVRSPAGAESQISPSGVSSRIVDVNPLGEVAFSTSTGLNLGSPDYPPVHFGPPLTGQGGVFWLDGNWFQIGAGVLYRLDITGRPTITTGPSGSTTSPDSQFEFTSSEAAPIYECRLDGGSFSLCTSPQNHPNLADGKHTFEVRLTNPGAFPVPARRVWTVDTTPPAPFDLQQPGNEVVVTSKPVLSWNQASDATTGLQRYEVLIDGSHAQELDPAACGGGSCSVEVPDALPDGAHTWQVRAVDNVDLVRESTRTFTVADPPTTTLSVTPALALTGEAVTFSASATDPNGGIVRYEWDLDGDGTFEVDTGTSPTASRTYSTRLDGTVKVRVTDSGGLTAEAGQHLIVTKVSAQGNFGISINGGAEVTNSRNVQLEMRWPSRAINALISNDGGFASPSVLPVDSPIAWTLPSSGPQLLPKTVYVRFTGGDAGRETYTDDIILDETQPTIQSATARPLGNGGSASATKSRARRYKVSLRARDGVTGITAVQVSNKRAKPGKLRKVKRSRRFAGKLAFKSKGNKIYVRVQDVAGNFSRWRKARITK